MIQPFTKLNAVLHKVLQSRELPVYDLVAEGGIQKWRVVRIDFEETLGKELIDSPQKIQRCTMYTNDHCKIVSNISTLLPNKELRNGTWVSKAFKPSIEIHVILRIDRIDAPIVKNGMDQCFLDVVFHS